MAFFIFQVVLLRSIQINVSAFCASLLLISSDTAHTLSHVESQIYSDFTTHSLSPIEISKIAFV